MGGLYLGDPEYLSLRHTMPQFLDIESRYGSVTTGLTELRRERPSNAASAFQGFKSGMRSLIDGLLAKIPAHVISTQAKVTSVLIEQGAWRIGSNQGFTTVDHVIMACPSYVTADLLRHIDGPLSTYLDQLEYASCTTVTQLYPRANTRIPERSFGFFAPRQDGLSLVAANFMSHKFPDRCQRDLFSIRSFLSHSGPHKDSELARSAHDGLSRLGLVSGKPIDSVVFKFDRAMPQFEVGFSGRLVQINREVARLPGLYLTGSSVGCVGIPDCVARARSVISQIRERQGSLHEAS